MKRTKRKEKVKREKMKNVKGITLIALIITIIVLLILAGVAIATISGEDGILQKAVHAKEETQKATAREKVEIAVLASYGTKASLEDELLIGNLEVVEGIDETTIPDAAPITYPLTVKVDGYEFQIDEEGNVTGGTEIVEPPIDKVEPKVGYYADIDGNGIPDGVIYADLAVSKSGQWMDRDGTYSYTAKTNTKDYYISQTNYEGPFGTKDVLTAIDGEEEDRFYVMALEDFNTGTRYCWYDAAYGNMDDYATATSLDFGTGKANTEAMIAKWNSSAYGAQNDNGTYLDMWGAIQDKVAEGWFVPSRGEWGAFGDNLGITKNNYVNYGLSDRCWSSSQGDTYCAWYAYFYRGLMFNFTVNDGLNSVRMSATF